jgi:hypothetical protein
VQIDAVTILDCDWRLAIGGDLRFEIGDWAPAFVDSMLFRHTNRQHSPINNRQHSAIVNRQSQSAFDPPAIADRQSTLRRSDVANRHSAIRGRT